MEMSFWRQAINRQLLTQLLLDLKSDKITIENVLESLSQLPFQDIGFAKVDHHRTLRRGFPEVILGQGKTPKQITDLAKAISESGNDLLITRISPSTFRILNAKLPETSYVRIAQLAYLQQKHVKLKSGVIVASAGTSDIPVAEEAAMTAELMGNQVERIYDVGVAGLQRIISQLPKLRTGKVIVVVAGMDGALPSVVSGLVSVPVIAVPTSIGYGASFGGLSALLSMLASCSPGVTVVNIDNGFGAGYQASMINNGSAEYSAEPLNPLHG